MQSLVPIDCGFDPRTLKMLCFITSKEVKYDDNGDIKTVHGCLETIGETLAQAGYSVIVAHTANGRDIQCTPWDNAPPGDYPTYQWDGPVWATQRYNDNYWCCGPSLASCLERAGWQPNQITTLFKD